MRSMVLIYISSLATMLGIAIISFITMKSSYMEAIENNMDDAIVYSVKMLQTDRDLSLNSYYQSSLGFTSQMTDEELSLFKKSFIEYLASHLDERIVKLDVEIYGADDINGMLSVQLTGYFEYPFGVSDHVSTYKTVIMDKYLKTDYNDGVVHRFVDINGDGKCDVNLCGKLQSDSTVHQ